MPVSGTLIVPSEDTSTPAVPSGHGALNAEAMSIATVLIDELRIPHRIKFTPSQLATDVGGSARAWQMECAIGNIGAVRVPGGWVVPWERLVRYIAERQNLVSLD